jgi:SPP1 family holin
MASTSDNIKTTVKSSTELKQELETAVSDAKDGKIQVGAVVRLIVLVIAWINQVAVTIGGYSIPDVADSVVYLIATTITIAVTLYAYWKNNSWSLNAKTADAIYDVLSSSGITVDEVANAVGDIVDSQKKKTATKKTTTSSSAKSTTTKDIQN